MPTRGQRALRSTERSVIKILHLISDLSIGGAEMTLYKLVSRMDRARFANVVVSMTDRGALGKRIEALGIPVLTLWLRRGVINPLGLLRLCRLLMKERPDVLQTWLYHSDLLGLLAGKISRVTAIAWNIRCSDIDLRHYPWLTTLVVRATARLSTFPDVVVVNSDAGRRLHQQLGFRPRTWRVIPNGFDLEIFRPNPEARLRFRRELGLPAETLLIGLIARYDPMKDHQGFLQAASDVLKERSDVHFVLVGSGIDRSNTVLTATIRNRDIGRNVHLLGERPDVAEIMPALDILALSSFGEGFSNVVGEAMASGVPCVVTDVGDAALIVGDTGKVVKPKDPQALVGAFFQMVNMDAEGRRRLGLAARQRIEEHFSLPAVVAQYEGLYEELARVRDRGIS